VIAYNKCDQLETVPDHTEKEIWVSAATGQNIFELKEMLGRLAPKQTTLRLVGDVIKPKDVVVLVTPIDESAPKGRMILPQVQAIRDILDSDAIVMTTKETELAETLAALKEDPAIVITDSQAFEIVDQIVPDRIFLTSFSILLARYKGFLDEAVAGAAAIDDLAEGARILVAEGCTHHRQCNDIGTVKLPNWLKRATGHDFVYETVSGTEFPEDPGGYDLILHCGGCMLTEREVLSRMHAAQDCDVPFTNYGITIAKLTGTLERSLRIFPKLHDLVI
jgi:[FeFe] hydrogenase H-cluster maturation GTPase HydF